MTYIYFWGSCLWALSGGKKKNFKKIEKKMVVKKSDGKKKCGVLLKKITKIKKKNGGQKSVGHIPTSCHWTLAWALVWPRSKSPEMAWNGASELLFGLGVNGTDFFLIVFKIFNRVVFPYDFCKKKSSFIILLGMSWYVFEPLLSDFQWTGEVLDHI